VTFVAGWTEWDLPHDRGASLSPAEKRNAISIVVRFEYGGKSVLLSGDAIVRRGRSTEPEDACRDAEKWMVREGNVPLDSDVLVGEHHGGDNSSALCFIEAVSPEWVIFSAGNSTNDHPRDSAVKRYFHRSLTRQVLPANILRTDRSDDEGALEWDAERVTGCRDPKGDDDIEIVLSNLPGTRAQVRYRRPGGRCAS
jgi:competence protein ComEC